MSFPEVRQFGHFYTLPSNQYKIDFALVLEELDTQADNNYDSDARQADNDYDSDDSQADNDDDSELRASGIALAEAELRWPGIALARSFFLERQARISERNAEFRERQRQIADSGVADVAHAQERERIRFVDQQAGDSDYSDCDEDGRNNGLAARVAREALFMESVAGTWHPLDMF